jgi:hypothetical protein
VDVEAVPPLDGPGQRAVIAALERAGVRVEVAPATYGSAWRAAALREGAEGDEAEDYALSPRSTRGATRA